MPKTPATPEVIEAMRERILTEALFIINNEGYASLSMRKLASRLGVTAKTIYNYYSNKDELYLMVLIKGFSDLAGEFRQAYESFDDPAKKLRAAMNAYVNWGIANRNYYNIMFSMDTPKYSDYVGTEMESVADRQNRVALEIPQIGIKILTELALKKGAVSIENVHYQMMSFWSMLHGMVSLYISRVTLEVWDLKGSMDMIIDDMLRSYECCEHS